MVAWKAAIPAVMAGASAAMGTVTQIGQARQQEALYNQQAQAQEYNIRATKDQQATDMSRFQQELARRTGTRTTQTAKSGLWGSTASDIEFESAVNAETDLLNLQRDFSTDIYNLESQLAGSRYAAKTSKASIMPSLLSGAINIGSAAYQGYSNYSNLKGIKT